MRKGNGLSCDGPGVHNDATAHPQPSEKHQKRSGKRNDNSTCNENSGGGAKYGSFISPTLSHAPSIVVSLFCARFLALSWIFGFFPRLRRLPGTLSVFKAFCGCLFRHPSQRVLRVRRLEHPRLGGNDTGTRPPIVPAVPPAAAGVTPCAGAAVVGATPSNVAFSRNQSHQRRGDVVHT